jgi:ribosome maturation factor RimP
VKIKTFQAIQGRKKFLGYLQGITDEEPEKPGIVTLVSSEGQEFQIPYELITSARLEVEF